MCMDGMKYLSEVNNIEASHELPRLVPKDLGQHKRINFTFRPLTHERAMVTLKPAVIDHDLGEDG